MCAVSRFSAYCLTLLSEASLRAALARVLEAARVSSTRPSTIPSAEQHAALMNELDETRLSLIKAINDAEGALAGKEAELARIQEELKNLKESDPSAEHNLDATACVVLPLCLRLYFSQTCSSLRLAMYKGLGFEPILGKDDRIAKMLVRTSPRHPYEPTCC